MARKPAATADALPQERQQRILARLRTHGRVLAAEFAAEFAVSEDSIRRDLRELAAQGLCRRVYGGALPLTVAAPLAQRREQQVARKHALARAAATLVQPGQVLLLDAGSTNSAIAAALPKHAELTVVTNAPDIAQRLIERADVRIVLIGGRVDPAIGAALGAQAVEEVQRLRADLCFPGTCAIDPAQGLWGFDAEEARFKRAMVQASGATVVVATDDKLGAAATHRIAQVAEVEHLVVESSAPRPLRQAFARQGVRVLRAGAA